MKEVNSGQFAEIIGSIVSGRAFASVQQKMKALVPILRLVKESYGRELASHAIGVATNPVWKTQGMPTPSWKPLATRWVRRKGHSRFYEGLRNNENSNIHRTARMGPTLESAMQAMPSEKLFGDISITVTRPYKASAFQTPGSKNQTVRYREASSGRFTKLTTTQFLFAPATVRIQTFPLFEGAMQGEEALIGALPIASPQKTKLIGNMRTRPLIRYFTMWFYEAKMRSKISRYMKENLGVNV